MRRFAVVPLADSIRCYLHIPCYMISPPLVIRLLGSGPLLGVLEPSPLCAPRRRFSPLPDEPNGARDPNPSIPINSSSGFYRHHRYPRPHRNHPITANPSRSMDDVEDSSELRRGIPVAHQIYGVPQTINTANYVYFLAVEELLALRRPSRAGSPVKEVGVAPGRASGASETGGMGGTGGTGRIGESGRTGGMGGSGGPSGAGGIPGSVAGAGAIGTASIDMAGTAAASSSSPDSGPSPKSRDTDHPSIHASTSADAKGKQKQVDLVGTVTDELLCLHRGQGLDLFWRDSLTCPTEEEYVHMVLGSECGRDPICSVCTIYSIYSVCAICSI